MTFVILDACVDVKDNSCVAECPVDCIYEGPRSMYVHPDECIDCGACEAVCPVDAVAFDADLPGEEGARHAALTTAFFAEFELRPGGAKRHGPLGRDRADVAALPA